MPSRENGHLAAVGRTLGLYLGSGVHSQHSFSCQSREAGASGSKRHNGHHRVAHLRAADSSSVNTPIKNLPGHSFIVDHPAESTNTGRYAGTEREAFRTAKIGVRAILGRPKTALSTLTNKDVFPMFALGGGTRVTILQGVFIHSCSPCLHSVNTCVC